MAPKAAMDALPKQSSLPSRDALERLVSIRGS
jgi:hypothetical protein